MPEYAASVQAVGLRIAKLDAAGAPIVGPNTAYTTKAFTKFSWTPEYEEGEEIKTTAADGTTCVYYKMPDTLKEVQVELEICNPQPEIYELLGGGSLLVGPAATVNITNKALASNVATLTTATSHGYVVGDMVTVANVDSTFNGTYAITAVTANTFSYAKTAANIASAAATGTAARSTVAGWAAPATGVLGSNANGVSIEVWSRAIVNGRPASVNPFWRWVMPSVQTRLDGDRTLENGALASVFSGIGMGNPAWGDGPGNDWLFPSTSAIMYARDANAVTVENYFPVV